MKTFPFTKIRKWVVFAAFLFIAGAVGYRLGEQRVSVSVSPDKKIIVNKEPPASENIDFSLFWDVWQRMYRYYIDAASLNAQNMVYGAISGMVAAAGDPYTAFFPPKENKDFKEDLSGEFEGIGAQLGLKESRIIVVAPLKGAPAEKAGILPGDWILKVNDEETLGWSVQQAVTKIRGPRGTTVKLNILHEDSDKPIDVAIVRNTINVPSVEVWVKEIAQIEEISGLAEATNLKNQAGKVAYLRLSRFGDQTPSEWTKAVAEIVAAEERNGSLKGLVFDLRNNPGGYLDGATFIASEFLRDGIVVSQVNSDGSREERRVNRRGKLFTMPLVVLINKGSASASEIVAGALRDHKRATIAGETSFGKGSVQTPQDLSDGSGLHITTGKWLLPNGDSINKVGIKPDFEVKMEKQEATADAQLAKAIELLLK